VNRTKGKTLEQMDEIFGDQIVPHALQDPAGADAAMAGFHEKIISVHNEEA
jgi:hypothetical protein